MNDLIKKKYDGIIIVNKPVGLTSHDVVYKIKKLLKINKIGHMGTLDPIATGVLPICVGQATKISSYVLCEDKKYRAIIKLGVCTDTFDITGEIISQKLFTYDKEKIDEVIKSFIGTQKQTVPIFSAIKKNGHKLYELARANIKVELPERVIKIYELKLKKFISPDKLVLDISCSKGTYIRSICNDIGKKLGCGAVMCALERTQVGNFLIKDSINLDDIKKLYLNNNLLSRILKITQVLKLKKIIISHENNKFLYNGNILNLSFILKSEQEKLNDGENYFLFDEEKNLIGIYKKHSDFLEPVRLFMSMS
jgi:tRNA pseudouridine55 synthase